MSPVPKNRLIPACQSVPELTGSSSVRLIPMPKNKFMKKKTDSDHCMGQGLNDKDSAPQQTFEDGLERVQDFREEQAKAATPHDPAASLNTSVSGLLDLRDGRLSEEALQELGDPASDVYKEFSERKLECLNISGNGLSDAGISILVDFLVSSGRRLTQLDLSRNKLCEPSSLFKLLEHEGSDASSAVLLRELRLCDNRIDGTTLLGVLEALLALRIRGGSPLRPPFALHLEGNATSPDWQTSIEAVAEQGLAVCVCVAEAEGGEGCAGGPEWLEAEVRLYVDEPL